MNLLATYRRRGLWLAHVWVTGMLWAGLASSIGQTQDAAWITLEKCPVVKHTVQVPTQERGFLRSLMVELNQSVTANQVLAELDTDLAELELEMAKLELEQAKVLASDDSGVKLQQVTLQQIEEELENYRSIKNSVSEGELRRLTSHRDKTQLLIIQEARKLQIAEGQEDLKAEAVKAAELQLVRRRIVAPRDGEVTAIKIESGQSVESGQTILEIEDLENLTISPLIPIRQFNLGDLDGAEVRVDVPQADAAPVRLSGEITSYEPQVTASGLVRIHARVKNVQRNGAWALLPGDDVTMYISKAKRSDADQTKAAVNRRNLR